MSEIREALDRLTPALTEWAELTAAVAEGEVGRSGFLRLMVDWTTIFDAAAAFDERVSVEAIAQVIARAMQTDPGDITPEVAAAAVVAWINEEED